MTTTKRRTKHVTNRRESTNDIAARANKTMYAAFAASEAYVRTRGKQRSAMRDRMETAWLTAGKAWTELEGAWMRGGQRGR